MTPPDQPAPPPRAGRAARVAVPYNQSPDVHEMLALLALSGGSGESADEVQAAMDAAFASVIGQIREGAIELDYQPGEKPTVNIPAIDHPHYMQALLYWSTLLNCRPAQLADAYAQLGSQASAESVAALVKVIGAEDALSASPSELSQGSADMRSTQPAFAHTKPMKPR